MLSQQANWAADGAPARDLSSYSAWREDADPDNLALLDFYGRYLIGQFVPMSDALSLDAVRAALDIDQIPREQWPEHTRRVLILHRAFVECLPKEKK